MTSRLLSIPYQQLTEPTSIAIAQQIECQDISTPLSENPIATAYLHFGKVLRDKEGQGKEEQGKSCAPMLLLHGFDSSIFEFRRLMPLLAEQTETWAIDLLGFGFTARSPHLAVTPLAIKTHLYHCWKTLIAEPVVLVGASMGGAAAIDFALTYPEAVRQLVLIDSAGFRGGFPLSSLITQPIGKWATAFLRNLKVRQNISLKAYHNPSLASADALQCGALHLEETGWQQSLISFTQSGGYRSFKTQLAQLQPPTLILWGENDRILGIQDAQRLHQAIPRSQLIWMTQCGHVPHLEQPQQTAAHILEFGYRTPLP